MSILLSFVYFIILPCVCVCARADVALFLVFFLRLCLCLQLVLASSSLSFLLFSLSYSFIVLVKDPTPTLIRIAVDRSSFVIVCRIFVYHRSFHPTYIHLKDRGSTFCRLANEIPHLSWNDILHTHDFIDCVVNV